MSSASSCMIPSTLAPLTDALGACPIQKLPDEMHTKIMRHFIDNALAPIADLTQHPIPDRETFFVACKAPTTLSQVCSTWRAVSHDDSYLWSRIIIPIFRKTDFRFKNLRWFRAMASRHITLSGCHPLGIKIAFLLNDPFKQSRDSRIGHAWFSLLRDLGDVSKRWKSLETTTGLNYTLGHHIWYQMDIERQPLFQPTALRRLSIEAALFMRWLSVGNTPLDYCKELVADVNKQVPKFAAAVTDRRHVGVKSMDLRMRGSTWRGSTADEKLASCILVLPRFANLRSLTIRIPVIEAEDNQKWTTVPADTALPMPLIRMGQLERICCEGFESFGELSIAPHLVYLETPNLTSFSCKEPYLTTLPDFLRRSHCQLTTLRICIREDQPELSLDDDLLQCIPNLTTLGISAFPGTDTDIVVQKLSDEGLLPFLKDITLEVLHHARKSRPYQGFLRFTDLLLIIAAHQQNLNQLSTSVSAEHRDMRKYEKTLQSYAGRLKSKVVMICSAGKKTVRVGWEEEKEATEWTFPPGAGYDSDDDA